MLRTASCFAAALLLSAHALAQTYPAKPVRIIVTNAPGVANDTIARGLSQYLGPKTGQPIVVDNRVGAEGIIGMEACANAAPDGYTYCVSAQGSLIVNPIIRAPLPYDAVHGFAPVVHLGFVDSALAVPASLAARSFQELLDAAKRKPESITWGVFSLTSSGNFYAEWLKRSRSVPFYVVPYKTPPQLLQALLNGEAHVGVYTPAIGLATQVMAGKLRILAVTSEERMAAFPDVPTFQELGIKLPVRTWFGLMAPAGTPPDIIRWLNSETHKFAQDPAFRDKFMGRNGVVFVPNTPQQFAAFIDSTRSAFVELLKVVPVKPR